MRFLPRMLSAAALLFLILSDAPAQTRPRSIHVFVALADNQAQGIVPVPAALGNGEDPARNLYWGAAYGIKTYFSRSAAWERVGCAGTRDLAAARLEALQSEALDIEAGPHPPDALLERCHFRHRASGTQLVADAYRGSAIGAAMVAFMKETAKEPSQGSRHLTVFVGHNGLMDAPLAPLAQSFKTAPPHPTDAMVFACSSASYFKPAIEAAGARPLVLTYGLMAPEAYAVEAAAASWIRDEPAPSTRQAAAAAYAKYQKSGAKGARRLFGAN